MDETDKNLLDSIDPDSNHFIDNEVNFSKYSMIDFHKSNITNDNSLNIMHNNSRSLIKEGRMDEYNILLDYIKNPFHILAFTETWAKSDTVDQINFEGYNASHIIRPTDDYFDFKEKGGGISIFIKENLQYKIREDLNVTLPYLETLFIEITFDSKIYIIGVIYRVPNTNVHLFNETLNGIIEPIKNSYEIVLVGDFNVCLMKENNQSNSFRNSLISNNLFPTILEPTRIASIQRNGEYVITKSLIDNIFINTQLDFKSGLIDSTISDHFPVFISIQHNTTLQMEETKFIKYRSFDDFSIKRFNLALSKSLVSLLEGVFDPKTAFTKFHMLIDELYNKYFPVRTKILSKKAQLKPWISQVLVNRIKIRDKLFKLSIKGRIDRNIYTQFRNLLTKQIRDAKATYFNNQFDNCKNDIRKTWKIINSNTRKKIRNSQIKIYENENVIANGAVPNKFINYFSNIATTLVSEIPEVDVSAESYLNNFNHNSFFMSPIVSPEIESAIMNLKDNGGGVYKVSTLVLKDVKSTISNILSIIFNLCIEHGYFPEELKIGCISPVFKKGDKTIISSYRPICSLSPFSKIFERIIYDRMINFIEKNKIFSKSQFGFRKNVSTETALINFIDFVHKGLTDKQNVGAVFMDLSKAFDVMNHDILENKLKHYGFRGNFLNLIMNFTRNRKYFVNVNGLNSVIKNVNIGVPQGSTLGPLLFLLYVNDMINCSTILHFTQFADDTTLGYRSNNLPELQNILEEEVHKVTKWLAANKLLLNVAKTHSMLFTFKRDVSELKIRINDIEIERKSITKFLGLQIDEKLNWKAHITHLCNKVSKSIAILRKVRSIFPLNILKMIYMSLIYSHLNYCILIWGSVEKTIVEPLFKLQKKAIRIISKSNYLDHTAPLFKSLKLLTVYNVFDLSCILFIYKCLNYDYAPELRMRIQKNSECHGYNTRNCNLFRNINIERLKICQRSFLNHGINLWNTLTSDTRQSKSIYILKNTMKVNLLNNS